MQLWKLGCKWSSDSPLFYDFIVAHKIVIGWIDRDYQVNDWLLITDGHTVLAFAQVLSRRVCVLELPEFEDEFKRLEIPFEKNLFVYKASFIILDKKDQFSYPLQQGIVRVQGKDYQQKFKVLRSRYMKEYKM